MEQHQQRLAYLRKQIEDECISYGEIAELQGLAEQIDPGDTLLLEWAGVPEYKDSDDREGWATDAERDAGTFLR